MPPGRYASIRPGGPAAGGRAGAPEGAPRRASDVRAVPAHHREAPPELHGGDLVPRRAREREEVPRRQLDEVVAGVIGDDQLAAVPLGADENGYRDAPVRGPRAPVGVAPEEPARPVDEELRVLRPVERVAEQVLEHGPHL